MEQSTDGGWSTDRGYIWSLIGSAIGFANLLGFGSQCYRYGGSAFLLPFFVAVLALGIPYLMLEGVVGKRTQQPLVAAYEGVAGKRGKFWGWLAVIAVTTIGAFYLVLTGWSIVYTYFAAAGSIPADTGTFFAKDVLHATGNLRDVGMLSLPVFFGTIGVVLFSWYVMSRNISSGIEKCCSIFLPILVFWVLVFAAVVCFLPGASTGFIKYLKPDFSRIADFHVWRDVFGQLFFSLSLGLGIVVGYSRHTNEKTCIRKAMIQVAMADFVISFIAGFVIFGCIGFMAKQQNIPFDEIVANASTFDIGYVIFPKILHTFGPLLSRIVGAIFFFSVFIAGITGVFSIMESVAGNIEVEFGQSRLQAATLTAAIMGVLTFPFCFGNGTAIIDALCPVVLGDYMLIGGIVQVVVFFLTTDSFNKDAAFGRKSTFALRYVAVPVLGVILYASLKEALSSEFTLADGVRWGWLATAMLIAGGLTYRKAPAYRPEVG